MTSYNLIPSNTLRRLPLYLSYLKSLPESGPVNISATGLSDALHLNHVQVRKDLAYVSSSGKPKIGYLVEALIGDIEHALGYNNVDSAVLVGAGHLGRALMEYDGFQEYGLEIVAAFDADRRLCGSEFGGKAVLGMDKLQDLCKRMQIHLGIIAVPMDEAQSVCNLLVESGIQAIWNFAPVFLKAPRNILVQNENLAVSLAALSKRLVEKNRR